MELVQGDKNGFVPAIPKLIWSEDPKLMALEFGSYDKWTESAEAEWPIEMAANSHDATTLAVEGTTILGLINAFPAKDLDARFEKSSQLNTRPHLTPDMQDHIDSMFGRPAQNAFYILDISVASAAQKTGLGTQLLKHTCRQAQQTNCTSVCLDVSEANPAVGFYQHFGFKVASRSENPVLQTIGFDPFLHMEYAITQ